MNRSFISLALAGATLLVLTGLGAPTLSAQEAAGAGALEEIIVTARKRDESLREIPESVSAISAFELEQGQITHINDIGLKVTNLNLSSRADGNPNVTIRGVGSFGNTHGVGFYVDGTQIFVDASAEFGDMERVEVLKGPQGTLYGGNNIGGAVKFVTKRPALGEVSGEAQVEAGGQSMMNFVGVLNLPLGEAAAVRVFGYSKQDDGFVNGVAPERRNGRSNETDTLWPYGIPANNPGAPNMYSKDVTEKWRRYPNERDEIGFRISLMAELAENTTLYAAVRYNDLDAGNNNWRVEDGNNLTYNRDRELTFAGRNVRETVGGLLELSHDVAGLGNFTYLGAVTDAEGLRTSDLDVSSEVGFDLVRPELTDVQTHEFRFTSEGDGPLEWQAGAYFARWENDWDSWATFYETTEVLCNFVPVFSPCGRPGSLGILEPLGAAERNALPSAEADPRLGTPVQTPSFEQETTNRLYFPFENRARERTNKALFITASYRVDDNWEIGIGARLDKWNADTLDRNRDYWVTFTGFYPNYENYQEQGGTEFLPKASISYFAEDGTHLYFSYARGFEPGNYNLYTQEGIPSLVPFSKETADNYEVGVKTTLTFADRPLDLNVAAFFISYTDRQFELQNQIAVGGIVENILNAGDSTQYGAEMDFTWSLSDELTITGGAGLVDADFDEDSSVFDVINRFSVVDDHFPPWISKSSLNLAAQYRKPLAGGMELLVRGTLLAKGPFWFNTENTVKHPGFQVFNLRVGVETDRWSLAVNVRNVFDEGYYTDGSVWPGDSVPGRNRNDPNGLTFNPVIGTLGQPRLTTFSAKVKF